MFKGTLLVIISGVMLGLARLPVYCGWMAFCGLIPLIYYFDIITKQDNIHLTQKENARRRVIWKKLLVDTTIFCLLYLSLYLHLIWSVTPIGFLGTILYFIIYFFFTFWGIWFIWKRLPRFRYIAFTVGLLTVEYLQNFGELRFPWINLGYSLSDYTIFIQAADIGGVALLSLLLILVNIFIYQLFKRRYRYAIYLGILIAIWLGYGQWCLRTIVLKKKPNRICIMQPSIPQDEKWETEHFDELYTRYVHLTRRAAFEGSELVIWPEAAMPVYLLKDTVYLPLVQDIANNLKIDLFTGFPDVQPAPEGYCGGAYFYNAATLFKPNKPHAIPYYKMILVPVGERMPYLSIFPFLWKLQFGQANWEFGKECVYYESQGAVFSPQICFEIAFADLNRKMAFRNLGEKWKHGKPAKIDFLVNITNDAWFGRTAGPWVHAMLTKFRSVENRIQIYRCANTGISMVVDPLGRILGQKDLFEIGLIRVPLYCCNKIPLYYYLHLWPILVCLIALGLLMTAWISKPILK